MENKSGQKDLFHSFNSDFANDSNALLFGISSDGKHFTGVWNLIKYIAQSIIYSRASGIDGNNFFTNVTGRRVLQSNGMGCIGQEM
jgi:hypothetical protein